MSETAKKGPNWIAPLVVAILAGACYYWLRTPFIKPEPKTGAVFAAPPAGANPVPAGDLTPPGAGDPYVTEPALDGSAVPDGPKPAADPVVIEYIGAYQQARWDDVIRLTCWMQDRLDRVRLQSADTETVAGAIEALRERTSRISPEENQLRDEGVEDQYVFAPDTLVEAVSLDDGRDDLERPSRGRTWMRVTYPDRGRALRDSDGLPIRSFVVGVNVSEDGLVLKANTIGNLDIDIQSVELRWDKIGKETDHGSGKLSAM